MKSMKNSIQHCTNTADVRPVLKEQINLSAAGMVRTALKQNTKIFDLQKPNARDDCLPSME